MTDAQFEKLYRAITAGNLTLYAILAHMEPNEETHARILECATIYALNADNDFADTGDAE